VIALLKYSTWKSLLSVWCSAI